MYMEDFLTSQSKLGFRNKMFYVIFLSRNQFLDGSSSMIATKMECRKMIIIIISGKIEMLKMVGSFNLHNSSKAAFGAY